MKAYAELEKEVCKRYKRRHTSCSCVTGLGFFSSSWILTIQDGGSLSRVIKFRSTMAASKSLGSGDSKMSAGTICSASFNIWIEEVAAIPQR